MYLGFFLIRYNLIDELIPDDVEEECKHLYSFAGNKPHKYIKATTLWITKELIPSEKLLKKEDMFDYFRNENIIK